MDKVKKLVLLSHCIINEKSKVKRINTYYSNKRKEFINLLIDNQIGILQLPCPEVICYGVNRWGHVKNQLDTPHYRKTCRELFYPCFDQIKEYLRNDYEIMALVGIDGSPTCGIHKTCIGNWGGEVMDNPNFQDTVDSITSVYESGVFIDEIKDILHEEGISFPFTSFNKINTNNFIDKFHSVKKLKNIL